MFDSLPESWRAPATLLFADYDHRKRRFSAWSIRLTKRGVEKEKELDLTSRRVHCFGSGESEANRRVAALERAGSLSTSSIVGVLISVIEGSDVTVGGPPQMIMLAESKQMPIGFWWPRERDKRYLFGVQIKFASKMEGVMWMTREFAEKPYEPLKRVDT